MGGETVARLLRLGTSRAQMFLAGRGFGVGLVSIDKPQEWLMVYSFPIESRLGSTPKSPF